MHDRIHVLFSRPWVQIFAFHGYTYFHENKKLTKVEIDDVITCIRRVHVNEMVLYSLSAL